MRIEDFCDISGLGRDTVEGLMRTGLFEGGLWRDAAGTRAVGVFEDALPSREELVALGLAVRDDYEPDP